MQKKPNYIPFFLDDIDALEPLGDAERGRLFTALLEYGRLGATEKNSGNERLVFPMFKGRRQVFRELRRNVRKSGIRPLRTYTMVTTVYESYHQNQNRNPNRNPKVKRFALCANLSL